MRSCLWRQPGLYHKACLLLVLFAISSFTADGWGFHSASEASLNVTVPSSDLQPKDGIYELDGVTFRDFIAKEPSVLMLFYAPWCHWCRDLLPRYSDAWRMVESQGLPIKFARLDGSRFLEVADTYEVNAFPTIKLFLDGVPHAYDGGRRANDIVRWVTSHLQTELTISSIEQLDVLLESNKEVPTLVAHFDKTQAKQSLDLLTFIALSRKMDHATFVEIEDKSVIDHLISKHHAPQRITTMKQFVLMINPHAYSNPNFESPSVLYNGVLSNLNSLEVFVKTYAFPALVPFDALVAPKAFKDGRPLWVLFTEHTSDPALVERALNVTRDLANKFRWETIFMHSDGSSIYDKRLQSLLGLDVSEKFPTVRMFNPNPHGHGTWYSTVKYRPSPNVLETFDKRGLEKFISDYYLNKLKPYVKSEPIPTDNVGPVKILVADQFEELVHKSDADVLVEFYAPWCGHCRKLEPAFNQLGQLLSSVRHIKVMKMDATQNEVHMLITGYPTIVLFVRNEKGGAKYPHYYTGDRSVNDMLRWIAQQTSQKFDVDALAKGPQDSAASKDRRGVPGWIVEEL